MSIHHVAALALLSLSWTCHLHRYIIEMRIHHVAALALRALRWTCHLHRYFIEMRIHPAGPAIYTGTLEKEHGHEISSAVIIITDMIKEFNPLI
jgi:hypothetical protein